MAEKFIQTFDSAIGFTYDNTKGEFVGGKYQQKDQTPNSTFVATFKENINGSYGLGVMTGTPIGGADILPDGGLDLNHNDVRWVEFSTIGNANAQQILTIKYKYIPNYNGAPTIGLVYVPFSITKNPSDYINMIQLGHIETGELILNVNDELGNNLSPGSIGAWSAVQGQEYEFELNIDLNAGITRLFIDGIQLGTDIATLGVRSSDINLFRIGADWDLGVYSNFTIKDFVIYNTIQHTENYTPGYTLTETRYVEDLITLPIFTNPNINKIAQFNLFTREEIGALRFNINSKYYNGGWALSDNSYAQMNSESQLNANALSLPIQNSVLIKLRTTSTNTQQSITYLEMDYVTLSNLSESVNFAITETEAHSDDQNVDSRVYAINNSYESNQKGKIKLAQSTSYHSIAFEKINTAMTLRLNSDQELQVKINDMTLPIILSSGLILTGYINKVELLNQNETTANIIYELYGV